MTAQILPFPVSSTAAASPIACYIRIGEAHRKLADLHAASPCCLHGLPDMIADPRRHAAYQAFQAIDRLQAVPDLKREHYFLNGPMTEADRRARQIKALKPSVAEAADRHIDPRKLMKRLNDDSRRLEQTQIALEHLHGTRGAETPRARPIVPRVASGQAVREDRL
jgi:hypothetical protein